MRIDPKLRAWVRYTPQGTIIPGSLILRKKRPSGQNWVEVAANLCCYTTSTTTSTSTTSTTTTSTTTTTTTTTEAP